MNKRKSAYFTLDDAPSKDFKLKIDYLYKKCIPAIIFCVGNQIANYEEDILHAINRGFIIGNHSYSHKHFSDLEIDECFEEIKKTDDILENLYNKANKVRPGKYFRFPYLDKGANQNATEYEEKWLHYTNIDKKNIIQNYLKELGYRQPNFENINIQWFNEKRMLNDFDTFITFDQMEYWLGQNNAPWGISDEKAILNRIEEDYPNKGRSLNCFDTSDIILVHDMGETTALFFKIIDRYLEKGINFILP